MSGHDIEISIIAPMYNEELNIFTTLQELSRELGKLNKSFEIIFVNDGSTDKTLEVCEKAKKQYPNLHVVSYFPNQGRGRALREGFKKASGKYTFTIDFDLSYDVTHITRMYQFLQENPMTDIVLVSCYMPGGQTVGVTPSRLFISKFGNKVLSHAFSPTIYTSTCVVRGYKTEVIKKILLEADDKEIHLEILSKALALGHEVKEIPGTLTKRKAGKSNFRFKVTSLSHIVFLLIERPALHFGVIGIAFLGLSSISGLMLLLNRLFHIGFRHRLFEYISPALVLLFLMISLFSFFFSLIGSLFTSLRREILKIQSLILKD